MQHALSREAFLAEFCNAMEPMLHEFQSLGFASFLSQYLASWKHSGQIVEATNEAGDTEMVTIKDVVPNGSLRAVRSDGTLLELHPDGNRLDMMHGLISKKYVS
mmetsp:Transcript_15711/g.34145  ORF Transcript_15711/g.34145 Transcript_15711/m.34145 type:complete len:104 (-) Transcript_15711:91-402(-)